MGHALGRSQAWANVAATENPSTCNSAGIKTGVLPHVCVLFLSLFFLLRLSFTRVVKFGNANYFQTDEGVRRRVEQEAHLRPYHPELLRPCLAPSTILHPAIHRHKPDADC